MQVVNQQHPALLLFDAGYGEDMLPVIPPGAKLSSITHIRPHNCGKIPGKRGPDGEWFGFKNWPKHLTSREDVERWIAWGASFGLRTRRFPFVDIDIDEPGLASEIADAVTRVLGSKPLRRVGRPPRCAIPFQTDKPFRKVIYRLRDMAGAERGAIEISGDASQVVVHGVHPKTLAPYEWTDGERRGGAEVLAAHPPQSLPLLTLEHVRGPLRRVLSEVTQRHGLTVEEWQHSEGADATNVDQESLRAPTIDLLAKAVGCIPNDGAFIDRSKYIGMLFAIRAAAGPDREEDGLAIAQEFCERWEDGDNDPELVRRDYETCNAPSRLGWNYLAQRATAHGFDSASLDFEVIEPPFVMGGGHTDDGLSQWAASATEVERMAALHALPDRAFIFAMEGLSGGALWEASEKLRVASGLHDPLSTAFHRHVVDVALNLRSLASEPALFEAVLSSKLSGVSALKNLNANDARLLRRAAWAMVAPISVLLGQRSSSPGTLRQPGKTKQVERQWLVEGWIPRCGVAGIVGAPGAGKSFVMTDLSFHVATPPSADELTGQLEPERFAGRPVTHGSVVYCGSEDVDGWMRRAERRTGDDPRTNHLYVASRVPPLSSPGDALRFVRDVSNQLRLNGAPRLELLIVDVFKAATTGDENSSEAMGLAMGTLHALSQMFDCAVVIVHHSAVSEGTRARGSSAIEAALDFEAVIEKRGDSVVLSVKKNKNGPSGDKFDWQLGQDGVLREGAPMQSASLPIGRACAEAAGISIRNVASNVLSVSRRELTGEMVASRRDLFARDGKTDRSRVSRAIKDACATKWIEPYKQRFRPGPEAPPTPIVPGDLSGVLA
jgi:hypothetical protein